MSEHPRFMRRPATIEEVATDLITQLGHREGWELADRCAVTTRSFSGRAFWLAVAEAINRQRERRVSP